jgi:predicted nicotinamide N-methyase
VSIRFDSAVEQWVKVGAFEAPLLMAGDVDRLIDDYLEAQGRGDVPADRSPFGAVLWPSGRAFVRWYDSSSEAVPLDVVELGTGVGLVSAYFAAKGARTVLATDYEPALAPFVLANAHRVCTAYGVPEWAQAVRFETLDWTSPTPRHLRGQARFLVATDVLYENVHVEFLPKIAASLLHPEGTFWLADPERYRFTAALANLKSAFHSVEQFAVEQETSEDDASRGVVNTGSRLTKIQILRCTRPCTSKDIT